MAQLSWPSIFLIFLVYQWNTEAESFQLGRIIHGDEALTSQFPYQVFIEIRRGENESLACGGTIITKRNILTAASCLDQDYESVRIVFGAVRLNDKLEKGQQVITISASKIKAVLHEDWNRDERINDIALIRLPGDLHFNEYIQPAQLPCPNNNFDWESVVTSGWGAIEASCNGTLTHPDELRYFNGTVLPIDKCQSIVHNIKNQPQKFFPSSWICVKPSESSTCVGDIGGPLVVQAKENTNILVGITTSGVNDKCAIYKPNIYTRVSSYLHWINCRKDNINCPCCQHGNGLPTTTARAPSLGYATIEA